MPQDFEEEAFEKVTTPTSKPSWRALDKEITVKFGASKLGQYKHEDVLAHEVGHFLGLGHSDVAGALMSPHC